MSSSTSVAHAVAAVLSGALLASAAPAWSAQGDATGERIIGEVIVTVERVEPFVFNPPRTYGIRMRVEF